MRCHISSSQRCRLKLHPTGVLVERSILRTLECGKAEALWRTALQWMSAGHVTPQYCFTKNYGLGMDLAVVACSY